MYVGGEATKLGPSTFKMATVSTSVDNRCKLQALLSNTSCLVDPSSIASPVFSISSKWQRLLFETSKHRMIERERERDKQTERDISLIGSFLTTLGLGWLSWLGLLALIEIGALEDLTFCVCTFFCNVRWLEFSGFFNRKCTNTRVTDL